MHLTTAHPSGRISLPGSAGRLTGSTRVEQPAGLVGEVLGGLGSTAAQLADAAGRGLAMALDGNGRWCPIVGVAKDTRNNGLTDPSDPEYYRLRMKGSGQLGRGGIALFRTSLDPATLAPQC